jgi:hypothetical protein
VIHGLPIFTRVGAVTTFLDADYTAVITTPAANTTRVTLTKQSLWTDPSSVFLSASYTPDGIVPVITATCNVVSASFTFLVAGPYPEQPDVSEKATVAFTMTSSAEVRGASLTIDEHVAVTLDELNVAHWVTPDYSGLVTVGLNVVSITADQRRDFSPEQIVPVDIVVGLTADGGVFTAYATASYRFYVRPRVTALFNPALRRTRMDSPFLGMPALEAHRITLLGGLKTRPISPGGEVLAYLRIKRSSLGGVAAQLLRPDLDLEVPRIVPEDLADVNAVDVALQDVDVLWESAVNDAHKLLVDPLLLDLLVKTRLAPYPQERVGAVAALVFAANAKLVEFTA